MSLHSSDTPERASLLPADLQALFQALSEHNNTSEDPIVIAKYFLPWSSLQWYATQYDHGVFHGFVTGFLYPEWTDFTFDQWQLLEDSSGQYLLRDDSFTPTPFSLAVPDNEKHFQGQSILTREVQEEIASILHVPQHASPVEQDPLERLDFTSVYQRLKEQYQAAWLQSPDSLSELRTLWWFRTNQHGVIIEPIEEHTLIDKPWMQIKIHLAKSPKGYCKYGISISTNTTGITYSPSIFEPVGYFTQETALTEAQAAIINWLNWEKQTAKGTALTQIVSAIKSVSALMHKHLA